MNLKLSKKFFVPFLFYDLKVMRTLEEFQEVRQCRIDGYIKSYADFVQEQQPDAWDSSPSATVFYVRDKKTLKVVGTMRVRHSLFGREVGAFDTEGFTDEMLSEKFSTVERFSITDKKEPLLVKVLLFSALTKLQLTLGLEKIYVYAVPAIERMHTKNLGFRRDPRAIVLCNALTNFKGQKLLVASNHDLLHKNTIPYFKKIIFAYNKLYPLKITKASMFSKNRNANTSVD